MSNLIEFDIWDYNSKLGSCQLAEGSLLSSKLEIPAPSSNSAAMLAFMQQVTKAGMLINQYKSILQSDIETLEDAKTDFFEADNAAAKGFE